MDVSGTLPQRADTAPQRGSGESRPASCYITRLQQHSVQSHLCWSDSPNTQVDTLTLLV